MFRLPQDCQGYLRVFLAADHLDNVVQVHVDDVNGLFPFLGHGDDLVLRLQQSRTLGASPGDQLLNDGKAIVTAEDSPDPLQRKLHLNPEVLKVFGRQVARVRIQSQGECLGEARNELFRIALDHPHRLQLVAVNLLLLGLRQVDACQQSIFNLELHNLSQERMLFRRRLHIGALVHVNIRPQNLFDNGLSLPRPRDEYVVYLNKRSTVARLYACKHALQNRL